MMPYGILRCHTMNTSARVVPCGTMGGAGGGHVGPCGPCGTMWGHVHSCALMCSTSIYLSLSLIGPNWPTCNAREHRGLTPERPRAQSSWDRPGLVTADLMIGQALSIGHSRSIDSSRWGRPYLSLPTDAAYTCFCLDSEHCNIQHSSNTVSLTLQ